MARLPPPVTMITCSIPLAIASSTPYWMVGLSTRGSISFGCALVTGRNRVPRPAAGKIAFLTEGRDIGDNLSCGHDRRRPSGGGRSSRTGRRRRPSDAPRRGPGPVLDPGHDRFDGNHELSLRRTHVARRAHDSRLQGSW